MKKMFDRMRALLVPMLFTALVASVSERAFAMTPIDDANDLQNMNNDLDGEYYLEKDIDCSEIANFVPVGTLENPFTGRFIGNGYTISNLNIDRPELNGVGLFGAVVDGDVSSVTLSNVSIRGGNQTGSLIGYLKTGTVSDCSAVSGTVSGDYRVGGLLGESYNGMGIERCHAGVAVNASSGEAGGFAGRLWDGYANNVYDSSAAGDVVSAGNAVGGFAGYNKSVDLFRCSSTGRVQGQAELGGLCGYTTESAGMHDCFSTSTLVGTNKVGGLVGNMYSYHDGISRSYFAGTIETDGMKGGLIGEYRAGSLEDNHWDYETAGLDPSADSGNSGDLAGVAGHDTATMKEPSTFVNWDFETVWRMLPGDYPRLLEGDAGPVFHPVSSVEDLQNIRDDLTADYYLTRDIDASITASWNDGRGFEPLGDNRHPFRGKIYGMGHTISNLVIDRPERDYAGLVGSIEGQDARIEGLHLRNALVTARTRVGLLAGYLKEATVSDCSVEGTVSGSGSRIGGFLGESYNGHGIDGCRARATVNAPSASEEVGGFVGRIWDGHLNMITESSFEGTVNAPAANEVGGMAGYDKSGDFERCRVRASVVGRNYVGGIAGLTYEGAKIHDCRVARGTEVAGERFVGGVVGSLNSYHGGSRHTASAAAVSGVSDTNGFVGRIVAARTMERNFWDIDAAGVPESPQNGVTAVSTRDFRLRETFEAAGWDFQNVWTMCGDPRLAWENGPPAGGSLVYQDFEPGNGTVGDYAWTWQDTTTVGFSEDPVHSGSRSIRIEGTDYWVAAGIQSIVPDWDTNFSPGANDRLVFWIYPVPQQAGAHNVGVKFFDTANYSGGYQVWTAQKAPAGQWSRLSILFSELPGDFDLHHVNKVEFTCWSPGSYYFDDIQVLREDIVYQGFELPLADGDIAWVSQGEWEITPPGEPVYDGNHSLKVVIPDSEGNDDGGAWESVGVQAQHSPWHLDVRMEEGAFLSFWVYGLPSCGMDTGIEVEFFDHGVYHSSTDPNENNPFKVWTKRAAVHGEWTELRVPLATLPANFDRSDLDKVQFNFPWPGTFYLDLIAFRNYAPEIERAAFREGQAAWSAVSGAGSYRLQERAAGGAWQDVFSGTETAFPLARVTRGEYRVRFEGLSGPDNPFPFVSAWSLPAEYRPPRVILDKSVLVEEQALSWSPVPGADSYEVHSAPETIGPWSAFYEGPCPGTPLAAAADTWYRVRARRGSAPGPWSPLLRKPSDPAMDFLRAAGTEIRTENGTGDIVGLKGVNLGSLFLIEPWMTGLGHWDGNPAGANDEELADDASIRAKLVERFGERNARALLKRYRESFLVENEDLDDLADLGVNLVRLPLYYRNFQDDAGEPASLGDEDFARVDRIVEACADRGIYVLLDLHGAHGYQNPNFHSGKSGVNLLFEPGAAGNDARDLNVALWTQIAEHYRDEPAVAGYDLLNEPVGVYHHYSDANDAIAALNDYYDRLYDAVRSGAGDTNHIVVMEGIWPEEEDKSHWPVDWETLDDPAERGWENVVYEFHYYNFIGELDSRSKGGFDGDAEEIHQSNMDFMTGKVAASRQAEYDVPVLIGEFSAMGVKDTWEEWLLIFDQQGWSSCLWSYKVKDTYNWGLYNHSLRRDALLDFAGDSYPILDEGLDRFDTRLYYTRNVSLAALFSEYCGRAVSAFPGEGGKASPGAGLPVLKVVLDRATAVPGEQITADLVGGDLSDVGVYGVQAECLADPARLEWVSADYAELFDPGSSLLVGIDPARAAGGETALAASLKNPAPPLAEDGVFARVVYRVPENTYGETAVEVFALFSDRQGVLIPGTAQNAVLLVEDGIHEEGSALAIGGTLLGPDGVEPAVDVEVTLTLGDASYSTRTGADGSYSFEELKAPGPDESYTVQAFDGNDFSEPVEVDNLEGTEELETQTLIRGDLNGDRVIDIGDFTLLAACFGTAAGEPGFDARADLNTDGVVNIQDLALLGGNFGRAA
jgi:aryl-phospho-beta-D-glucosidase BglC (GH1 family)